MKTKKKIIFDESNIPNEKYFDYNILIVLVSILLNLNILSNTII